MIQVSIIVPIFNASQYLNKCLQSLVEQSLADIEIIAIDDGSTDNSGWILDEYQKKYPDKVRAFHQKNSGISVTRNRGIGLAEGKYIAFVDSDDSIELDFCEKMVEMMEKNQLDMVVCNFYEVDETGMREKKIPEFETATVFQRPELLFDINTSPWNKLYRKDFLLERNILFPLNLKYEDVVFIQTILSYKAKVGYLNSPLIYYLVHPESETTVVRENVFDIFKILDTVCSAYKKNTVEEYEKVRNYLEYFIINRITVYNLQQIYQQDEKLISKFIEKGFGYLNSNFPKWRKNPLFASNNNVVKKIVKGNERITKWVVWGMRKKVVKR